MYYFWVKSELNDFENQIFIFYAFDSLAPSPSALGRRGSIWARLSGSFYRVKTSFIWIWKYILVVRRVDITPRTKTNTPSWRIRPSDPADDQLWAKKNDINIKMTQIKIPTGEFRSKKADWCIKYSNCAFWSTIRSDFINLSLTVDQTRRRNINLTWLFFKSMIGCLKKGQNRSYRQQKRIWNEVRKG